VPSRLVDCRQTAVAMAALRKQPPPLSPIILEKLGVQGFVSDIAVARTWYERAKQLGSARRCGGSKSWRAAPAELCGGPTRPFRVSCEVYDLNTTVGVPR
jgi:hypothetical protein